MYLWQKIVAVVLILGLIGAGVFGFLQTKKLKERDTQIVQLKKDLEVARQMREEPTVEILRISEGVKSGTMFDPSKVEVALLPESMDSDSYMKDPNLLKDAIWRLNMSKNSLIMSDMLALEPIYPTDRFQVAMVDGVTPSLEVGDFVDIRMITADGIDFVVMPKKRVTNIYTSGLEIIMSESEWMIYCGSLIDKFMNKGTVVYASKYVDPALQNKLYATYIPPKEIVDYMNINKNMLFPYVADTDIVGLRSYIESVQPYNKYSATLFTTAIQAIRDRETRVSAAFGSQIGAMNRARGEFITYMKQKAAEEGVTYTGTITQSSQANTANVQGGSVSAGVQRPNEIRSDGTYTDENGVQRRPDGTPVIQATDIVNSAEEEQEEAAVDDENANLNIPVLEQ